ncbi:MAG TPA: hypothetical protein VFW66_09065 [Gemmatimonadales bacterium]|nr:hypothetical protein [Gemmatimonadales bacterium]
MPELGPSLGHLCAPPDAVPPPGRWIRLDDLRLELATRLFELAGAARGFASAGDRAGAIASLNRVAWLSEWERTVRAATARLAGIIEARLNAAASEARLPGKRRLALALTDADRRALTGRLGSGGLAFVQSLDALERTVPAAISPGARGAAAEAEWRDALTASARRLESAWLALETAADREQTAWAAEVERVRAWRRPTRWLWIATAGVLIVAAYLGLVFGGYLPVLGPLRGLAQAWWRHLP